MAPPSNPARRTYWDNPSLVLAAFPNLIEAAWRSDAGELAKEAASDLRDRTGERPSPLVCALLETAAALGSRPSRAEVHFEAALQRLPWRDGVVGGRIALLYGEWLRRQKRKLDAREQLRNAHATLAAAGASAFADRARRELAATGERTTRAIDGGPGPVDAAGGPRRPPRHDRSDQRRDRRAALPECQHRRLPLEEGLPKARRDLAAPAERQCRTTRTTGFRGAASSLTMRA